MTLLNQFSLGNKLSLKELIANPNSTVILKQFVKDRYCIPEGMNLVMISNGKNTLLNSIENVGFLMLFQTHFELCNNVLNKYFV